MNKYEITATVTGKTVNDVASKMMTASYLLDFELEELHVELAKHEDNVLFFEDVEDTLKASTNNSNQDDTFNFPHVRDLINGLNEKKRKGKS